MPTITLTDLALRSLKVPPKGQVTYFDNTLSGFGVRCSQGGTKTFVVIVGADRRRLSVGRYPTIKLTDARTEAKRILAEHTLGKSRPRALSYDEAKRRYLEACRQKNRARTVNDYEWILNRHFRFSRVQLADITLSDIRQKLARIKNKPSQQVHAFVAMRAMLKWCVRAELLERSVLEGQPLPAKTTSRERVLSKEELTLVYTKARAYPFPYGPIVTLLILTGQRRGEITALERDWIDDNKVTLPASITKNGNPHTFPLGAEAQAVIGELPESERYLFPATRSHNKGKPTTTFNGWTNAKVRFNQDLDVEPYTLHDLRRTFSSNLAMLGVPLHVTEKLLNHTTGSLSGVAGIYNRHTYLPEMREALCTWENYLAGLTQS